MADDFAMLRLRTGAHTENTDIALYLMSIARLSASDGLALPASIGRLTLQAISRSRPPDAPIS
jgi:hypothetical protein